MLRILGPGVTPTEPLHRRHARGLERAALLRANRVAWQRHVLRKSTRRQGAHFEPPAPQQFLLAESLPSSAATH